MSGAVRRELVGAKRHGGDVSRGFRLLEFSVGARGVARGRRIVWVRAKRASADDAEGAEKDVRKGSLLVVEGVHRARRESMVRRDGADADGAVRPVRRVAAHALLRH